MQIGKGVGLLGCIQVYGVYISTYIYEVSVRSRMSLAFVVCMNYVPDMVYILPILGMFGYIYQIWYISFQYLVCLVYIHTFNT